MAFKIVNRTYYDPDRKPEAFGFIEGYTSNTVGKTYLRMNIKEETDDEKLDWYKRLYGSVPRDVAKYYGSSEYDIGEHLSYGKSGYLRERRAGDCVGEGIRLDRGQVLQLIWELIKWLVKGC